jgi:hypothetical protein
MDETLSVAQICNKSIQMNLEGNLKLMKTLDDAWNS